MNRLDATPTPFQKFQYIVQQRRFLGARKIINSLEFNLFSDEQITTVVTSLLMPFPIQTETIRRSTKLTLKKVYALVKLTHYDPRSEYILADLVTHFRFGSLGEGLLRVTLAVSMMKGWSKVFKAALAGGLLQSMPVGDLQFIANLPEACEHPEMVPCFTLSSEMEPN